AAEAERAAIARELHDMIAHSVSVIAVRAESATYTTPDLSPPARDAFQEIAGTARASMAELRRLLGVLRT
ncbi:two-component sensor histidine kinase, partial [Streptomyces sp. BF-3]